MSRPIIPMLIKYLIAHVSLITKNEKDYMYI